MQFDDAQVKLLASLAHAGAVCHIPFFANTLPLGYHYLRSVQEMAGTGRLQWHDWKEPVPVNLDSIGQPHVFYAAEKSLKDLLPKVAEKDLAHQSSFVTQYVPRRFFMEYTIGLDHACAQSQPAAAQPRDQGMNAALIEELNRHIDCLEILTDIPDQANLVELLMRDKGFDKSIEIRTIRDELQAIALDEPSVRVLRLYFYGGPITSALGRRPREFLAFELGSFDNREKELFKTYICVVSFREDKRVKDFCEQLERYHQELFRCAEEEPKQLRNVWWTYNRCADLLQHNSQFPTVEDFALCLIEHHKASYRPTISEISDSPPDVKRGDHVHFGAGNLSLGLVLPFLRGPKRLAIIQRQSGGEQGGFSWSKIRSWKTITFKNEIVAPDHQVQQFKFKVAFDDGDSTNADKLHAEWGDTPLFICTNNLRKFKRFIEEADSLSASIGRGQGHLRSSLGRLDFHKTVCLYSFENDHEVQEVHPRVTTVRVIPDRICTDRHFERGRQAIRVRSEPYVELVVQGDPAAWAEVWGTSPRFKMIGGDQEYVFFHRRKRYLVSAVHLVLAVYGYHLLEKIGVAVGKWEEQYIPLLEHAVLSSDLSPLLRTFVDLQILRLITETNDETMRKIFGSHNKEDVFYDLRWYSEGVLTRMLSVSDTLKRVLDLKSRAAVKRKYSEHFNRPRTWLDNRGNELRSLPVRERLLGCDIAHVLQDAFDRLLDVSLVKE